MDKCYTEAQAAIENALYHLKKVFDQEKRETPEDRLAYNRLENLIDRLDTDLDGLRYFASPVREGRLREDSNGKFTIEYSGGGESHQLSCGSSLEIEDQEADPDENQGWLIGRVEGRFTDHGNEYYFFGGSKPALFSGMRVRLRLVERE